MKVIVKGETPAAWVRQVPCKVCRSVLQLDIGDLKSTYDPKAFNYDDPDWVWACCECGTKNYLTKREGPTPHQKALFDRQAAQ